MYKYIAILAGMLVATQAVDIDSYAETYGQLMEEDNDGVESGYGSY